MKLAMVGLGKMGANMARRLIRGGHECVVYDVSKESIQALAKEGATPSGSLEELVRLLQPPRIVWMMLPLFALPQVVESMKKLLSPGDILIDGGNTLYKEDIVRAKSLGERGISYVDIGTSGGIWGLERGYCMMVGGAADVVQSLNPIFETLAPGVQAASRTPGRTSQVSPAEQGFLYCGPVGSGHFAKMVHNGIEYGVMQAYAEGLELLNEADRLEHGGEKFNFPIADVAEVWRRGSVISSWLLDLIAEALTEDPKLGAYSAKVEDTGEGRWTVAAAVEAAVPLPVITASLFGRFQSRVEQFFAERIISAMRNKFGGHQSNTAPTSRNA